MNEKNVKNNLSDKDKMTNILQFLQINIAEFAKKLEINADELYNLNSGRKVNFSQELRAKIIKKYEQINPIWILTGEGPMLRQDIHQNEQTGMNVGGDNIVGGSSKTTSEGLDTLIATNAKLAATLQQQADQIGKLIEMLNRQ